ncbi:MAG: deoxyribodipyrimidine photo-lyase [Gammaproteobacteria bacterium]|nr:deoxyribodipyrimidine photo-lyase [Gammaproteobacteria bacterium]
MSTNIIIHWFRQDLRIADNPSLFEAAEQGVVLPIYILDEKNSAEHNMGDASRWWLHHSLIALNKSLNGKLSVFRGDPKKILIDLIEEHNIKAVYWNRCYEPWRTTRDAHIKKVLKTHNTLSQSFNASLLWEPWENLKADGTPYKVFTPYYKNGCLKGAPPRIPKQKPLKLKLLDSELKKSSVVDLNLLPEVRWDQKLEPHWNIGEAGAQDRLHEFIDNDLANYKTGRDYPALKSVSRLSPHLHFGEISPVQIWYVAKSIEDSDDQAHFLRELGWREFSHNLLYHFPDLPRKNLQKKFDQFPWLENKEYLQSWQRGQTGYPLVDAGMRQLWQTGYMHNRVRMIVGSFLVKNLLLHWHHGERWFWNCLVDADLANNSASWQWIAGCGADAAPYFRVFNPSTQGQKFDSSGEYTRQFVPELANLPNKYLFNPWEAPDDVLQKAGVIIGETYPAPIVDLKNSRIRALDAYKSLQSTSQ